MHTTLAARRVQDTAVRTSSGGFPSAPLEIVYRTKCKCVVHAMRCSDAGATRQKSALNTEPNPCGGREFSISCSLCFLAPFLISRSNVTHQSDLSGPTAGVALFGPKVSDQSSSLSEELPVRMEILLVYSFSDKRIQVPVG